MIRKIIHIDREKCNGCEACVHACHEGAIGMKEGKALLLRDDYCDGLGDCLPACPTGAITFEEREADAYDEAAVMAAKKQKEKACATAGHTCPGSKMQQFAPKEDHQEQADIPSELTMWPVQIKLAPPEAPYFENADLLIAADCTAYAYANFHRDFIKGRTILVGCPKLDEVDYSEKLTEIIRRNDIRSVEVVRMEVPCCGGLEMAVKKAVQDSGKALCARVKIISVRGEILD